MLLYYEGCVMFKRALLKLSNYDGRIMFKRVIKIVKLLIFYCFVLYY